MNELATEDKAYRLNGKHQPIFALIYINKANYTATILHLLITPIPINYHLISNKDPVLLKSIYSRKKIILICSKIQIDSKNRIFTDFKTYYFILL